MKITTPYIYGSSTSYQRQAPTLSNFNPRWCSTLQGRHSDHDGVPNHQPHDCLLNRLFRRGWTKTSKLRVTGLCEGNSLVTGEFPAQRASNAENVSIWWRHHVYQQNKVNTLATDDVARCDVMLTMQERRVFPCFLTGSISNNNAISVNNINLYLCRPK